MSSLAYDLITSSAGPALAFANELQQKHMGAAAALARALGTGIRGLTMAPDRDAALLADVRAARSADVEPLPISYEAALAADCGRARYGVAGLRGPAEELWSGAHDAADQIAWDAIYEAAGRPPAPPPRYDAHRSLTEYGRPAPFGEVSLACLWASTAIREEVQGGAAPTTGAAAWERYGGLPYAWSVPAQRPEGEAWARFDEVYTRRARVGMEMIPVLRAALAARLARASAAVAQIRQEIAALPARRVVVDWTASECMYSHLRGVVEVDGAGWWLTLPGQDAAPLPTSLVADRVEDLLLRGWPTRKEA